MNDKESVLQVIQRVGDTEDKLIEVLMEVDESSNNNYVTEMQLEEIAKELGIPLSRVYGVASFYSMLSTEERGKYVIQICHSGPCYVKGSDNIVEIFEKELGIKMGEVTEDKIFSLEYTSCIGACDIAPAAKINEKVYGNLNKNNVHQIIEQLRKEER